MLLSRFFSNAIMGVIALVTPLAADTTSNRAQTLESGFISYGDDLNSHRWYISKYNNEASWLDTVWTRDAVEYDPKDGALVLSLSPAPASTGKSYQGGEVQLRRRTSFGRYEVIMTAAPGDGVVSSFFTYTGPHFETPHDEIDFEFLGRNTTEVWLTAFVEGEKKPGQAVDLGFDATEGPHLYAFDWQPDSLTWYVDGRELLHVTAEDVPIPSLPQKIFFNIWVGGEGQHDWTGAAAENTRSSARYYCISYRPPGADTPQCSNWSPQ